MSWVPAFMIGLWNVWLFMIVYPLQWLVVPGLYFWKNSMTFETKRSVSSTNIL